MEKKSLMKRVLELRIVGNSGENRRICLHGHHSQAAMSAASRLYMNKSSGEIALACRNAEYC